MSIKIKAQKMTFKEELTELVILWNSFPGLRWRSGHRSPFTSEVAGSILSDNILNVTRTLCSTHVERVSQHSAESRGFSPGTPVSSHKDCWQGGLVPN